jgi:hypothetical protein
MPVISVIFLFAVLIIVVIPRLPTLVALIIAGRSMMSPVPTLIVVLRRGCYGTVALVMPRLAVSGP